VTPHFALLLSLAAAPWPRAVDGLELHGNKWTHERVVRRELPFDVPGQVSEVQWELFITRLWNLGIFSRVDAELAERGGSTVAVVTLEERITLNPLVSFGVGGGAWWFRVGATDNNFLGTFLEWGARYERFDTFNGLQAWVRDPRLFGLRLDGLAQFDYLIRPRPEYVRRRLAGIVDLSPELSDTARVFGRFEVFHDDYFAPNVGEARVPASLLAGTGTVGVTLGRVDIVRLRQKGAAITSRATLGLTDDPATPALGQFALELLWFVPLGERWNLCLRAQAALSTAAPPELQFYLGGLDLVRGYPDSLLRTHRYALANLELRLTVLDFTWFALVAAAFADGAVAEVQGARGLFSVGAGVRLLVPRFVRTGVRADFALTLAGKVEPGISLGVYQFF
jgi:hypothetical protein